MKNSPFISKLLLSTIIFTLGCSKNLNTTDIDKKIVSNINNQTILTNLTNIKETVKTIVNVENEADLRFESGNPLLASVDEKGNLTPLGTGIVELKIFKKSSNELLNTLNIRVQGKGSKAFLMPPTLMLDPEDRLKLFNNFGALSTTNTDVLEINDSSIIAKTPGITYLKANDKNKTFQLPVGVTGIQYLSDNQIQIDGKADDWGNIKPMIKDKKGDAKLLRDKGPVVDYKAFYMAVDTKNLYIRFDLWEGFPEIRIDNPNTRYEIKFEEKEVFHNDPSTRSEDDLSFKIWWGQGGGLTVTRWKNNKEEKKHISDKDNTKFQISDICEISIPLDEVGNLNKKEIQVIFEVFGKVRGHEDQMDKIRIWNFSKPFLSSGSSSSVTQPNSTTSPNQEQNPISQESPSPVSSNVPIPDSSPNNNPGNNNVNNNPGLVIPTIADGKITIDGESNDWSGIPIAIADLVGDSNLLNGKTVDLRDIYLAKDFKYFYVRGDFTSSNSSSSELDGGFTLRFKKESSGNSEGDLEYRYFESRKGIWLSKIVNGEHEGFRDSFPSVPDSDTKVGQIYELKIPLSSIGNVNGMYLDPHFYCCESDAYDTMSQAQITRF
jgi:hypothetical protein